MTFLRPAAFLILPALVLLLWIVRQIRFRRPFPATTFLLLARAHARLGAAPRRRSLALRDLARLLPVALVVAALAGPVTERTEAVRPVVVLVNRSASMATRSDGGTRLDRARAKLPDVAGGGFRAAGLPPADVDDESAVWRPTIAEIGAEALVRAALERLAAGDRVLVVTDQELPDLPAAAGVLIVTDATPNAGLAACGLDDAGRLLVRIAAQGMDRPAFEVVIEDPAGGAPSRALPVPPPAGPGRWVFEGVRPPAGGRVRARLLAPDANPLDDEVVLVPASGSPRIGFPAEGSTALWRAFAAQTGLEIFRGDGPCELRVNAMSDAPEGWSLLVAPVSSGRWRTGPPRAARGALGGRDGFIRSSADELDLPSVHAPGPLPPGAEILARVGDAPLLVQAGTTLLLLQAPELSAWPARESFPLFVFDLLRHLDLRPAAGWRASRGGEVPVFVRAGAGEAVLTPPSGAARVVPAGEGGQFLLTLEEPGIHVLAPDGRIPGTGWPVIVSGAVLSDQESGAPPAGHGVFRRPAEVSSAPDQTSFEPVILVLAAAAFLAIEILPALRRRRAAVTSTGRSRVPSSPGA